MNLFSQQFKKQDEAEKIKRFISGKNTPFDKARRKILKEINNN